MNDTHESVDQNAKAIFRKLVGDRVSRLDGSRIAEPAMSTMVDVLAGDYEPLMAHDIAFHIADWNSDAAFIVAVHFFQNASLPKKVTMGLGCFWFTLPITFAKHAASPANTFGRAFLMKTKGAASEKLTRDSIQALGDLNTTKARRD